jgi:hypothetical protein
MSSIRTTVSIAACLAFLASAAVTAAQEPGTDSFNASSGGEVKAPAANGSLQGVVSTAASAAFQAAAPATSGAAKEVTPAGSSLVTSGAAPAARLDLRADGGVAKEQAAAAGSSSVSTGLPAGAGSDANGAKESAAK